MIINLINQHSFFLIYKVFCVNKKVLKQNILQIPKESNFFYVILSTRNYLCI